MSGGRGGFTLIETLVAIIILGIGLLAMAATSGAITTTLTGSRMATVATQLANLQLETLRLASRSTTPGCASGNFSSSSVDVVRQGVTMSWTVPATGMQRRVVVRTTYPVGRGHTRTDSLVTMVPCY